jgi:hypothetical protein
MSWHYRDIQTFPARYSTAMIEAVAKLGTPILFNAYSSPHEANSVAETIRWFRWCIRQKPDVNSKLGNFEALYQFRITSETMQGRTWLYLTAKPTKLSELSALNPHLADLIAHECQP